jgi:hypothetical protein
VIKAWLNSPDHKKNLFNSYYKEIGVAVEEGMFDRQNTILVVQIFGAPPLGAMNRQTNNFQFQNYPLSQNYLPYYLSSSQQTLPQEKLLTHAANEYLIPSISFSEKKSEIFLNEPIENNSRTVLNKFFVQYNLHSIFKYFNFILSAVLLLFMFYIYFMSFSRLSGFS